jgi:hypothetical protein
MAQLLVYYPRTKARPSSQRKSGTGNCCSYSSFETCLKRQTRSCTNTLRLFIKSDRSASNNHPSSTSTIFVFPETQWPNYATLHLRLYVTLFNKGRCSTFSNFRIAIDIMHLCDNKRIGCTSTHSGRPIAGVGRQTRAYSLLRDSDSGPAPCYAVLRTVKP